MQWRQEEEAADDKVFKSLTKQLALVEMIQVRSLCFPDVDQNDL